ncbi:Fic family protein [Myxococcota bacterium]|nr:Fic family protein [Myxococcota bacterium]MBU1380951.1 Fic family protein [Myxococcota bacterium]MBU1495759.1 Fic family protein [Myxococcota bacterium]
MSGHELIISGAEHIPPDALQVESAMISFINWCNNEGMTLHPVVRAARIHADFVKIHPFTDGNGRTSRLLMNLELMKNGFPPPVVTIEKRLEYYESLDEAHTKGNYNPFYSLIFDITESAFNPYWHALTHIKR